MTITDRPVDNGVNVQALLGAREALSASPEHAQFTWRASCTWRNGTHSRSTVTSFSGLGALASWACIAIPSAARSMSSKSMYANYGMAPSARRAVRVRSPWKKKPFASARPFA